MLGKNIYIGKLQIKKFKEELARLSKEDCKNKESESITNQINLIKNYIYEKSGITIKMTKIDDGY